MIGGSARILERPDIVRCVEVEVRAAPLYVGDRDIG